MTDQASRWQLLISRIQNADPKLGEELKSKQSDLMAAAAPSPAVGVAAMPLAGMPVAAMAVESAAVARMPLLTPETIVLRTGRPVLQILNDEAELTFRDVESEVWRTRLTQAKSALHAATRAVGRVEVTNHPMYKWVGTGWLVQSDVVVTNRHVANLFGRQRGEKFVFRSSAGQPITADIDFLEEFNRRESKTFGLLEILHIEDDDGPDIAFLRVESGDDLAKPIALSARPAQMDQQVALIGYPARDSRIPEPDLMTAIFGDVYDKKRLAPGQISGDAHGFLQHDASTLGGNSGSVVLSLDSGEALGLHFAGRFLEANFAVPAATVADRLNRIGRSSSAPTRPDTTPPTPAPTAPPVAQTIDCVVPVHLKIELGPNGSGEPKITVLGPAPAAPRRAAAIEDVFDTEAPVDSYADRTGYESAFLGTGAQVKLPAVTRDADQIVEFEFGGKKLTELKYQHYSVVMHRKRRICFFSAVNIDGKQSKKTVRPGWRTDPRIPKELQIIKECYGSEPKFSRGHMTRREDPAWGTKTEANLGCADSMHVTNAVPQMQSFNGGIWLGLEDYALQNAREDDMRITVITGPFLHDNDPIRFDVKIPRSFWKVIAFVHDQTKKLCASGYTISQNNVLPEEEFVFGEYDTHQRSLKSIEKKAGISFGALAALDVFGDTDEEALPAPLTSFSDIRFVPKGV